MSEPSFPLFRKKSREETAKRIVDEMVSIGGLSCVAPIMAAIAICIKVESKGPIIFEQPRLGYKGKIFKIKKFRTMVDRAWKEGAGFRVSEGDKRITGVGKVLRRLHLDEIPQLVNVLKGEMSIIGPRAGLPFMYDYLEEWERKRLDVLPGITGWAQVNGANRIDWDERIRLDVWYVENWSLFLDARIVARTIAHIVARAFYKNDTYNYKGQKPWKRGFPENLLTHSLYGDES